MQELVNKIKLWGRERNIDQCDSLLQTTKTLEECMELQRAIIKYEDKNYCDYCEHEAEFVGECFYKDEEKNMYCKHLTEIQAAIGDIFITLVMLGLQDDEITEDVLFNDSNIFKNTESFKLAEMLDNDLGILQKTYTGIVHSPKDYPIKSMIYILNEIAKNYSLTLKQCVEFSYNQIKDRKGSIVDGLWEKEQ